MQSEVDRIIHEFMAYLRASFRQAFDNLLVTLQHLDIIGNQSFDYERVIMQLLQQYLASINSEELKRRWDYSLFGAFGAGYGATKAEGFFEYSKLVALAAGTTIMINTLTNSVAQQLRLIRGITGKELASQLANVYQFAINRGELMAITEFHRAAIIGQLTKYERQHIQRVKYHTAEDELVCPKCSHMNGQIVTLLEAHGIIPLHPKCRCWWDAVKEEPV